MGAMTWHDATYANGPRLVAWIEQNVRVDKDDDNTVRRLYEWKIGGSAQFLCVDRVLVRYGHHVSELPDEVWLQERPARKKPVKRVQAPRPPQKFCAGCGEPISYYRLSDGRAHGPAKYAKAKFCSRECSYEVLSGNPSPLRAVAGG